MSGDVQPQDAVAHNLGDARAGAAGASNSTFEGRGLNPGFSYPGRRIGRRARQPGEKTMIYVRRH